MQAHGNLYCLQLPMNLQWQHPVLQVALDVVDDFETSARGAGGFGSTGRH